MPVPLRCALCPNQLFQRCVLCLCPYAVPCALTSSSKGEVPTVQAAPGLHVDPLGTHLLRGCPDLDATHLHEADHPGNKVEYQLRVLPAHVNQGESVKVEEALLRAGQSGRGCTVL